MKKILLPLSVALIGLFACTGNSVKNADTTITIADTPKRLVAIKQPDDVLTGNFNEFLQRFNIDSVFQKKQIAFPLKVIAVYEEGDTIKYVPQHKWTYVNLMASKNNIIKTIKISKTEVNVVLMVEDTGVHVNHYFIYKKSDLQLAYVKDESD